MKVCVISLNNSKGNNISTMLSEKGLKPRFFYSYSSPDLFIFGETLEGIQNYIDAHYDDHDAYIEFPYSMCFEHMYSKDPETKFIYVNMPKEKWIETMTLAKNKWGKAGDPYAFEEFFCNRYVSTGKNKMQDLTDEELGEIYDAHNSAVDLFFQDKEFILRIDYNDSEFAAKISDFVSE